MAGTYKLTAARKRKLIEACREGVFRDQAAAIAGISRPTLNRWLRDGRRDSEAEVESELQKFYDEVSEAEALFEQETMARIRKTGENTRSPHAWTANAWLLERKFPERYGRTDRLQVQSDRPLIEINVVSDPAARELSIGLLEALASAQQRAQLPAGETVDGEAEELPDE
jgi:DNA-binding transcriptional regulator LsrR (DeoR family)